MRLEGVLGTRLEESGNEASYTKLSVTCSACVDLKYVAILDIKNQILHIVYFEHITEFVAPGPISKMW